MAGRSGRRASWARGVPSTSPSLRCPRLKTRSDAPARRTGARARGNAAGTTQRPTDRGGVTVGIRNVLVGTDLSDASDAVVAAAAGVAAHTGAVLHLVHAFEFELMPYVPEVREPTLHELRHRGAEERLLA